MTVLGRCLQSFQICGLILFLATSSHATTVRPLSGQELIHNSSDIVVGSVAALRPHWDKQHRRLFTEVKIVVSQSLKGVTADTLTLTQMGGELDGVRFEVPGAPRFTPGEEVLLFAWRDRQGRAQANGLSQGKCTITSNTDGSRVVHGLPADLRFRPAGTAMRAGDASPAEVRDVAAPLDATLQAIRAVLAKK